MIKAYIKRHIKHILAYIIFMCIFAIIFSLQRYFIGDILYATSLCVIVAIIFIIYDYWKFYQKNKNLVQCQKEITNLLDNLPETTDLIELNYQQLIKILFESKLKITLDNEQK